MNLKQSWSKKSEKKTKITLVFHLFFLRPPPDFKPTKGSQKREANVK
jgi:hypothetical protein